MTSKWEQYHCEARILAILRERGGHPIDHHLGPPYLTAYQLAIEFNQRHPEVALALDVPVGGAGAGGNHSLAQYLAHQLSVKIKTGEITQIEGGLLSDTHLEHISFRNGDESMESTLTGIWSVSMYRAARHTEATD